MRLTAEPMVPFALWLALAIAAAMAMLWYIRKSRIETGRGRRIAIWLLMSVSLLVPLVILLNPTVIHTLPPPAGKPILNLVIDASASMTTEDVGGKSRETTAREIAAKLIDTLKAQFEIRLYSFGSDVTRLNQLADLAAGSHHSNCTNLIAAIERGMEDAAPQGHSILLLSDGIHNTSSAVNVIEVAKRAKAMNVPVYTMTVGGDVGVKNVSVHLRSPQELAFVDQPVPIVVGVESLGLASEINVSIWQNDQQIDEKKVRVDPQTPFAETTFSLSEPAVGLYRYQVRVSGVAEEATLADNRATLLLRVVDQPVQVLLLEGKPYWDTKFLIRSLAADKSIQLTSLVKLTESRFLKRVVKRDKDDSEQIRSNESSEIITQVNDVLSPAKLKTHQILILGRESEVFFTDEFLKTVRDWISRDGGSLICSRGVPSAQITERLAMIMPVQWSDSREQRFRVKLTEMGRDLRWLSALEAGSEILGTMPTLAATATPTARPGLSNVLVSTGDPDSAAPVVSYQQYGLGRTIVVEGAGMWRWALLSPKHETQDQVYGALWRSLLRWLVSRTGLLPGSDYSLQADRVSFETGEVATATMRLRSESQADVPLIELQLPDQSVKQFTAIPGGNELGVYRVEFPDLSAGSYAAEAILQIDGKREVLASTAFDVRESWVENLALDARHDLMKRIADETGGSVIEPESAAEVASEFQTYLNAMYPRQIRREQVWDRWWFLLTALGLWAGAWAIRRNTGLV